MKTILKALIVLSGLLFVNSISGQSPNWMWQTAMGDTSNDVGTSIATDAAGNIFTTGYFRGTVDFDPGPNTFYLSSTTGFNDAFICKSDAAGNLVWVKAIGGTSSVFAESVTIDAADNIFMTGEFVGTADFDPGLSSYNLTNVNSSDVFVLKLNATGNFVWAKQMAGINGSWGNGITLDGFANVYTTGAYNGTVDFDPGSTVYNLTSSGLNDFFISKFDSSGNFVWARSMGNGQHDVSYSIRVDNSGNVYTTGLFGWMIDLNPDTAITYNLISAGDKDVFISKLDPSGNFVWGKAVGGTNADHAYSITLDGNDNVYITGSFYGVADFDPGIGLLQSFATGYTDIFVLKLDSAGNFVWVRTMGGVQVENPQSIASDPSGNIYTTGYFKGTADFDPGAGIYNLTAVDSFDVFVCKLDSSGNFGWAKSMGGNDYDKGLALTVDASHYIYVTGSFYSSYILFDNDTLLNADINDNTSDMFIAKLDIEITGVKETNQHYSISISPNPATTTCTITLNNTSRPNTLTLYDLTGRTLLQQVFNGTAQIDVSNLARGMYIAEVKDKNGNSVKGKLLKE